MWAVPVSTDDGFTAGAPVMLFEGNYLGSQSGRRAYDVTSSGEQFVMIKETATGPAPQLVLVLNWLEELGSQVPAP